MEMTYDPKRENLAHLRRIATGLADFSGRSRRSEFLVYLIAMMVIGMLGLLVIEIAASGRFQYSRYAQLLLWLPATSLFVRRLHDQNRSGWLALILPTLIGLKISAQTQFDAGRLPLPSFDLPLNVVEGAFVIAFWVLMLWPGTEGENRFGPDPRLDPAINVR
jgi:uncharacterized membrane protein YhaH (DUF805 family)